MFRDFEPAEVPTSNGRYIVPSECAPQSITTWAAILREAEGALRCVRYGWPGWGSEGLRSKRQRPKEFGDIGVFIWGVTSQIAHDYDARGHLTAAGENRNMSTVETA